MQQITSTMITRSVREVLEVFIGVEQAKASRQSSSSFSFKISFLMILAVIHVVLSFNILVMIFACR